MNVDAFQRSLTAAEPPQGPTLASELWWEPRAIGSGLTNQPTGRKPRPSASSTRNTSVAMQQGPCTERARHLFAADRLRRFWQQFLPACTCRRQTTCSEGHKAVRALTSSSPRAFSGLKLSWRRLTPDFQTGRTHHEDHLKPSE